MIEHVGSTSVPGLAAKPIIDIVLAVADSAKESDYCGSLEEAGYTLHIRDWLRANSSDRELYERTKRDLAKRNWARTQEYADAKTPVVKEILERALRSS